MKSPLQFGLKVLVTLATLTRFAPGCGDPSTAAVPGTQAKLIIQTEAGTLRMGEAVFANLILPKGSELPTGTLGRHSCSSLRFKVEPASGWHDPWADWYDSGIPQHATGKDQPFRCGVMGVMPGQDVPPPQINFTLNDWVQFDRPGKYRISVVYRTEFRKGRDALEDPYDDRKSTSRVTLATAQVEVEVLPEPADVAKRAAEEIALLRDHFQKDDPAWGSSDSMRFPTWTAYSQSEAVVPLLAQFYEQSSGEARRGLIASPHQVLVVQEMEKKLDDPRHAVAPDFLDVLALNAVRLQHPDLFGDDALDRWSARWEEASQKRNEAFLAMLSEYTRRLLAAMPHKHEGPQRDSLNAVLLILSRWDIPNKAQLRTRATNEAAELWPRLKQKPNVWEEEWKVVASPALLPLLRKQQLDGNYMRWLYQLAPKEARRSMIAAAAREDWETAAAWSSVMPEGEGPSTVLDTHLLRNLKQEPEDDQLEADLDAILLARGGPEMIVPVRQILASESCLGQPALWAFLLKHEGVSAESRLLRLYDQQKADASCDADLSLQDILRSPHSRYWSTRLEAIVVSELDDTDSIAIRAAHLLELFGSKDAESALWARLEKWHRSHPLRPSVQSIQNNDDLEETLLTALLDGRSWAPNQDGIKRLRELCVYRCDSLKWARSVDQLQHLVVGGFDGDGRFQDGPDSLAFKGFKAWIQRFPPHTQFAVTESPGNAPLTPAQVEAKYPILGQLIRELKFEIVDTLSYDEYGRCRESRPAPSLEAESF